LLTVVREVNVLACRFICVLPQVSSAPSVNTISENKVYQTQFCE
jgi:hypothetical protein